MGVSLCASLPLPSPPLLPAWQAPLLPTMSPAPCIPPTLPPLVQPIWPTSLPPSGPPSLPPTLQSPLQDAVPLWDASHDDPPAFKLPKAAVEDQSISGINGTPTARALVFL